MTEDKDLSRVESQPSGAHGDLPRPATGPHAQQCAARKCRYCGHPRWLHDRAEDLGRVTCTQVTGSFAPQDCDSGCKEKFYATPGPWDVRLGTHVFSPRGRLVASTGGHQSTIDPYCDDENAANARLIAAAPDLLSSLGVFVDRYTALINSGDVGYWNPEEETHVIAARAAIAKAEGR